MTRTELKTVIITDDATGTVMREVHYRDRKLHRTNGPALIERDPATGAITGEAYYLNDELHRANGPAIIERDPATGIIIRESYWRDGKRRPSPTQPKCSAPDLALLTSRCG